MKRPGATAKQEDLIRSLGKLDSLLVAFSGGVDSAFLLAAASEVFGEKVAAAMGVSAIHGRRERDEAVAFAANRGIELILFHTNEMEIPEFVANGIDRCYHCKGALSEKLLRIAFERGISHVAHGANMDDLQDYRPGLRAADKAGIMAPLIDAALWKEDIRTLAKEMGLPQWNKPAGACLASRFPYGCTITKEGLDRVERAEEFLIDEGFSGVRVRHHGAVARIETDASNIARAADRAVREKIVERLRRIGFEFVALDLEGYVSGKMNREIRELRN